MAKESGGLYLPLSIDLSAWEQSLAAADADMQKAMREMRASMKDLKMKYDIEIAGAKVAGDELKVLELETAKLNNLYTEQKRVMEALSNAYKKSVQEKGESAQASQVLAKQLINESKQLDRLKYQLETRQKKLEPVDVKPVVDTRALQAQERLQKELRDVNASAYEKEINALKDKRDAYIKAGASEVDAAKLYTAEKAKLDKRYTDQAIAEEERRKKAIESAKQKELDEAKKQADQTARTRQREIDEQKRQAEQLADARKNAKEDLISGALQMVSPRLEGARRTINGLTSTLDILGGSASKVAGILTKYGGYGIGIGVVAGAFTALKHQIDETRASILQATESTYKLIEHLSDLADTTQLPIDEVQQLSYACRIAGANIDSIAPALNRLDKAVLGGDKTLEQFGLKLTDASGNLKGTNEQLQALADTYSRMKAEGRGGEFVAQLGKQAAALLPLISRLADADFANVSKLLADAPKVATMLEDDAKYLGELDRALQILDEQLANAKGAEATQFKIQAVLRDIEDAKEEMQLFNETASSRAIERSGISALDDELNNFDSSIRTARSSLSALISETQGYLAMRLAYGIDSIRNNSFEDFDTYKDRKAAEEEVKRRKRDNERIQALLGEAQKPATIEDFKEKTRQQIDKNFGYADQELKDKLYTQRVEEYAKQRELARQREAKRAEEVTAELRKQLRDATASEEERALNSINDKYEKNAQKDAVLAEKIKQAELKKLADEGAKKRIALEEKLTDVIATEQEKRLKIINREYEDNAKTDAVLAERIRQAELRKMEEENAKARTDAMDKIRAVLNTDFQNRMEQIQREKDAWIKAGADRVQAEEAAQKQINAIYKQAAQEKMSEAERLLTEQKEIIKDIQKGLSDEEIKSRADKRYMKNRGINQSMIDTLDKVGFERINELANTRERLFGRFAQYVPQVPEQARDAIGFQIGKVQQQAQQAVPTMMQNQQIPQINLTVNFDNTVVEDVAAMDKIANKVSDIITPAIQQALRGESYGY